MLGWVVVELGFWQWARALNVKNKKIYEQRSVSEKIDIPTFKNKTKNPISDIFRSLYKIHIRLIQNNKTLS